MIKIILIKRKIKAEEIWEYNKNNLDISKNNGYNC